MRASGRAPEVSHGRRVQIRRHCGATSTRRFSFPANSAAELNDLTGDRRIWAKPIKPFVKMVDSGQVRVRPLVARAISEYQILKTVVAVTGPRNEMIDVTVARDFTPPKRKSSSSYKISTPSFTICSIR